MLLCLIIISQTGKHHNLHGYLTFQNQKNPDVTADEAINRLFADFGFQAQQTLVCTSPQKISDFQEKRNGTGEGTRTPTPKALGPKPSASTTIIKGLLQFRRINHTVISACQLSDVCQCVPNVCHD